MLLCKISYSRQTISALAGKFGWTKLRDSFWFLVRRVFIWCVSNQEEFKGFAANNTNQLLDLLSTWMCMLRFCMDNNSIIPDQTQWFQKREECKRSGRVLFIDILQQAPIQDVMLLNVFTIWRSSEQTSFYQLMHPLATKYEWIPNQLRERFWSFRFKSRDSATSTRQKFTDISSRYYRKGRYSNIAVRNRVAMCQRTETCPVNFDDMTGSDPLPDSEYWISGVFAKSGIIGKSIIILLKFLHLISGLHIHNLY